MQHWRVHSRCFRHKVSAALASVRSMDRLSALREAGATEFCGEMRRATSHEQRRSTRARALAGLVTAIRMTLTTRHSWIWALLFQCPSRIGALSRLCAISRMEEGVRALPLARRLRAGARRGCGALPEYTEKFPQGELSKLTEHHRHSARSGQPQEAITWVSHTREISRHGDDTNRCCSPATGHSGERLSARRSDHDELRRVSYHSV